MFLVEQHFFCTYTEYIHIHKWNQWFVKSIQNVIQTYSRILLSTQLLFDHNGFVCLFFFFARDVS